MPPHILYLKFGYIVTLSQITSIKNGLKVLTLHQHSIEASLINAAVIIDRQVLIPIIKLDNVEINQFPAVPLCLSDDKQEKTFYKMKLFFPQILFSHSCLFQELRNDKMSEFR